VRWVALVSVVTACRIAEVDYTGKQCPCPDGYACDLAVATCVRGSLVDAAPGGDGDAPPGLLTYRAAVLADAPVAYWRLDDTASLAVDELGHVDGTYGGACTHGVTGALAGDPDHALHLDGTSCKVTLPDKLAFPNNLPYSVEAWVLTPTAPTDYRVVFSKESRMVTGPVDGYALVDSPAGIYLERSIDQVNPMTVIVAHPLGRFFHVVGVYDGAAMTIYVDAVPATFTSPDARSMPAFSGNAFIGGDSFGDFYPGTLDEVAVYDHALAPARITLHHDLGVNGPR
jgi:hypothetical protein